MEPLPENNTSELEKETYLEFRDIFTHEKAAFRRPKVIKKVLENPEYTHRLDLFCSQTGERPESIIEAIRRLLQTGVFTDNAAAKAAFPELFELSEEQRKQKEHRETEAAESEAGAIAASVKTDQPDDEEGDLTEQEPESPVARPRRKSDKSNGKKAAGVFDPPASTAAPSVVDDNTGASPAKVSKGKSKPLADSESEPSVAKVVEQRIPDIFPVYLPYPVQHALLSEAQRILEDACFDFASVWMQSDTNTDQFMHPQSAELPMWARLIRKRVKKSDIPEASRNNKALEGQTLRQAIKVIEDLRHTAVHRLRTHAKGIQELLAGAVKFTKYLKDEDRTQQLERILEKATQILTELESEKILMRNKLERELTEIEEMRRELKRREVQAVNDLVKNDRKVRESVIIDMESLLDTSPTEMNDSGVEILDSSSVTASAQESMETVDSGSISQEVLSTSSNSTTNNIWNLVMGLTPGIKVSIPQNNPMMVRDSDTSIPEIRSSECGDNSPKVAGDTSTVWLGSMAEWQGHRSPELEAEIGNMDEGGYESAAETLT